MSATTLSQAYANVLDFRATTSASDWEEASNNRIFLQAAINSRRHVLFPTGTYRFHGTLIFGNDDQRTTFMSGAILEPYDNGSYVLVTGARQTFEGLRIETTNARSPVLEIYRAADLLMDDLIVSVSGISDPADEMIPRPGPKAAVRVMNLVKCNFIGGRISGDRESGSVGLWLASSYDYADPSAETNCAGIWPASSVPLAWLANTKSGTGAYEVGAVGLRVDGFGWAVRVGCICDDPSFFYCTFTNNVEPAVRTPKSAHPGKTQGSSRATRRPPPNWRLAESRRSETSIRRA